MTYEVVGVGCLSRALLDFCAKEVGEEPISLYQRLLTDCVSAGYSCNAIANLNPELATRFYGSGDKEPRFCSIDDVNNVAHLKKISGVPFVLYQVRGTQSKELTRIFDNRVLQTLCLGEQQQKKTSEVVLVIDTNEAEPKLLRMNGGEECVDPLDLKRLNLCIAGNDSNITPVGNCLLSAVCKVLSVDNTQIAGRTGWSLIDFFSQPQEVWNLLKKTVTIVEHIGCKPWTKGCAKVLRCKRQRFKTLLRIYDRESVELDCDPESTHVVALSHQGYITLVNRECSQKILQARRADDMAVIGNKMKCSAPVQGKKIGEKYDEQVFKASMGCNGKGHLADYRKLTPCNCEMCKKCGQYSENLDKCGSQKLYTIPWDIMTYMKIFNLHTTENVKAVRDSYKLSVSGMDLETTTVPMGFRPDSSLVSETLSGIRPNVDKITATAQSGDFDECVQRILLIGHIDDIQSDIATSRGCVKTFETPRSVTGVRDNVHTYIKYVMNRQKEMEIRKRKMLEPLLTFVDRHKEVFFEYYEKQKVEMKDASDSWKNCLFGKFEKKIQDLCKKYYIYSFNGSGFDMPLLCGHIATAPWLKRQWTIQRSGSSVTTISMPTLRIYFRGLKLE